jgi:WD40 repeat protein
VEVRLWDAATGEELHSMRCPQEQVMNVCFSPDSRMLATAGYDHTIRFWETATGRQRAILRGHQGPVNSLAFSRDGRCLASGSRDATALLWDLPSLAGSRPEKELSPEELRARWTDLAADDANRAYRAIWTLAISPRAVQFLGEHVRSSPTADARRLAQLLADLDSDAFAVRDRTRATLEELGETAEAALKKEAAAPASAETGR